LTFSLPLIPDVFFVDFLDFDCFEESLDRSFRDDLRRRYSRSNCFGFVSVWWRAKDWDEGICLKGNPKAKAKKKGREKKNDQTKK